MSRWWFYRHVIGLILLMNLERLAERHFGRHFAVTVTNALAMLFQKFRQLGFGNAVMRRLERLPNFFAGSKRSGIVPP